MKETGDSLAKSFKDAFGDEKSFRIGEYVGHDMELNPGQDFEDLKQVDRNRQYMRTYFDECIYNVQQQEQKV